MHLPLAKRGSALDQCRVLLLTERLLLLLLLMLMLLLMLLTWISV